MQKPIGWEVGVCHRVIFTRAQSMNVAQVDNGRYQKVMKVRVKSTVVVRLQCLMPDAPPPPPVRVSAQ